MKLAGPLIVAVLTLAVVVSVPVAVAAATNGTGLQPETAATAATQDPATVEASLALGRPARRLIQQGLRNAGFDPGTPDGLFGPRTRTAIRDWQQSRGASPTGYLNGAEAELLRAAAAPPPTLAEAPPPTRAVLAGDPSASSAAGPTGSAQLTPENHPDPPATTQATAPGQLPPAIMLDSYLLRAEQALRDNDREGARAAMQRIAALQREHELVLEPEYHYRYARIWNGVGVWDQARASIVRYLELVGRDGEHYLDALTVMNRATAEMEAIARERELRAAAEARARDAEARERAERERSLNAARGVIAGMEFAAIPPGEFRMGKSDRRDRWRRRTDVQISRAFKIGRYEVTQSEWETVMGTNPSLGSVRNRRLRCARCPVENVSWEDVQRFISALNFVDDAWTYRLPTEAEWEYAARAGARGEFFAKDLNESAWHADNSDERTHPVGSKQPNGFGLYDMIGNVEELTQDWQAPYPGGTVVDPTGPSRPHPRREKVTRGCHYRGNRYSCESASRESHHTDRTLRRYLQGFRLVRTER